MTPPAISGRLRRLRPQVLPDLRRLLPHPPLPHQRRLDALGRGPEGQGHRQGRQVRLGQEGRRQVKTAEEEEYYYRSIKKCQ